MIRKEILAIRREMLKNLITLITAAFGFVAAFAWNETVKSIFVSYYGETSGLGVKIIYATSVTVAAVIITIILGRMKGKVEGEMDSKRLNVPKSSE